MTSNNFIFHYYLLLLFLLFLSFDGRASDFYFTDTYGNKLQGIYSKTNNYLSLHSNDNDTLSIVDIKCYKNSISYSYKKQINELRIYPNIIPSEKIFVYILTKDKVDSIQLQILQPFYSLEINISSESSEKDTLHLKSGKSVFIDLQIADNYKYITKFEENIYLLSSVFWDKNEYQVIIRRKSYSKYELLFPYNIFHRDWIKTPARLLIYPYSIIKNEPQPILHRSVNYVVKIE